MNNISHIEKLFSYGTLRYEAVQLSTFGRKLNGIPAILCRYKLSQLKITDQSVVSTSGEDINLGKLIVSHI